MLSCLIGTACALALLWALLWAGAHFHFNPPSIVWLLLLGPLFILGFTEPRGGTAVVIFGSVSIALDVLYYGGVVLIIWKGASWLNTKWRRS